MGLFGLFEGIFTASKVHDKLHDGNESLGGEMLDMGASILAGEVVKGAVDSVFDDDEENEYDDDDFLF